LLRLKLEKNYGEPMTDKKPKTRPEKAEYAICWDAGFMAGKEEGFEQGKLAGSLLSTDKSLGKNDVKALIDMLENDWATLQKKNPEIAREMLTHYVNMWNIPVSGYDNKTVIEMIWDGRLSGINASGYWFDNYDRQKSYYVASRLKSQLKDGEKDG
jgi:hypothetical protein